MATRIFSCQVKATFADSLGTAGCAVDGNGAHDQLMLSTAALGTALIGPDGASARTLSVADVVTTTVGDPLDSSNPRR